MRNGNGGERKEWTLTELKEASKKLGSNTFRKMLNTVLLSFLLISIMGSCLLNYRLIYYAITGFY
jgi:hypothetical protein